MVNKGSTARQTSEASKNCILTESQKILRREKLAVFGAGLFEVPVMGFLLRCCFWIGLALLFIPIGTGGGEDGGPSVNPIQTLVAARDAVADIASICERQPAVCETASAAMQTVIARASEGMRLAQQLIDSNPPEEATPSPEVSIPPPPAGSEPESTGSIQ